MHHPDPEYKKRHRAMSLKGGAWKPRPGLDKPVEISTSEAILNAIEAVVNAVAQDKMQQGKAYVLNTLLRTAAMVINNATPTGDGPLVIIDRDFSDPPGPRRIPSWREPEPDVEVVAAKLIAEVGKTDLEPADPENGSHSGSLRRHLTPPSIQARVDRVSKQESEDQDID